MKVWNILAVSVCIKPHRNPILIHTLKINTKYKMRFYFPSSLSTGLLKNFQKTSKRLPKDFRLYSLQNLYKSQPPGLRDLLVIVGLWRLENLYQFWQRGSVVLDCVLWVFDVGECNYNYRCEITEDWADPEPSRDIQIRLTPTKHRESWSSSQTTTRHTSPTRKSNCSGRCQQTKIRN